MLAAARCLARYHRCGKTPTGTKIKWAVLGWAIVEIFPIAGHTADSLLDTTLEDTKLYFTAPLRWAARTRTVCAMRHRRWR